MNRKNGQQASDDPVQARGFVLAVVDEPLRSLHVIDIENLMEGPRFSPSSVARVKARYQALTPASPGDHLVIASSHFAAPSAWFAWPEGRRLIQSGPDGADLALLNVLAAERVAERFGRVVVASGDGIFADAAARLQGNGCNVTVIARRPSALSRRLRIAVREVRFIDPAGTPVVATIQDAA